MTDTPISKLGEALVREGVITPEQLSHALRIQKYLEQPKPLGSIVVELGYTTKRRVAEVLKKYGSGMRLGEMLLEQGLITPEGLEQALRIQKEQNLKLGEALVQLGILNERTLLQNLAHQAGIPYVEPQLGMIDPTLLTGLSPEYLEKYLFVPFTRDDEGTPIVVVHEVNEQTTIQAVQDLYKGRYKLALGPLDAIKQTIQDFRSFKQNLGKTDKQRSVEEDSIVQLVNQIISTGIDERASDIHIEPMSDVIRLRYRIDGVLVYKMDLPKDLLPRISSRIKIMAECNIAEHQHHQGGRILFNHRGQDFDLRLSIYITVHGECMVLRILNKQTGLIDLEELGMNRLMLDRYRTEVLDTPTGVVLITGPTGSGKTTTLYSSLHYCNTIDRKIITAEDPVEYMIDGLIQCSIYDKIGRTFEATLREIVRQDPDIIVLGEIRDKTSAETAIQAALTGHKVYSTFHTEDTIGGLLRLIDMDIETFLISSTVISVVAQRLLRRICDQCAAPYTPSPVELDRLGIKPAEVREFDFRKGRGCKHCNHTGYRGRIACYELLILNEDVKEAILQKRASYAIRQICVESTGLVSMREDGISKVIRGDTTFSEVLRNTPRTVFMRPVQQILAMTQ